MDEGVSGAAVVATYASRKSLSEFGFFAALDVRLLPLYTFRKSSKDVAAFLEGPECRRSKVDVIEACGFGSGLFSAATTDICDESEKLLSIGSRDLVDVELVGGSS